MSKWVCLVLILPVWMLSAIDINIEFDDGHKISYELSEIEHISFTPAADESNPYLCIYFVQSDSLCFALSSIKEITFSEIDDVSVEDLVKLSAILPISSLRNYPNPFNPSTTISFSTAVKGNVTVEVFNSRGQLVSRLMDKQLPAGDYSLKWDGTDDSSRQAASGIYYYRVSVDESAKSSKMLYLK